MALALAIIGLLNTAAPGIADIVAMIRKKDGSITMMPLLDEASATFNDNLGQAAAWLTQHPAPAAPKTAAPFVPNPVQ